jgi:hypothetical protein
MAEVEHAEQAVPCIDLAVSRDGRRTLYSPTGAVLRTLYSPTGAVLRTLYSPTGAVLRTFYSPTGAHSQHL